MIKNIAGWLIGAIALCLTLYAAAQAWAWEDMFALDPIAVIAGPFVLLALAAGLASMIRFPAVQADVFPWLMVLNGAVVTWLAFYGIETEGIRYILRATLLGGLPILALCSIVRIAMIGRTMLVSSDWFLVLYLLAMAVAVTDLLATQRTADHFQQAIKRLGYYDDIADRHPEYRRNWTGLRMASIDSFDAAACLDLPLIAVAATALYAGVRTRRRQAPPSRLRILRIVLECIGVFALVYFILGPAFST